MKGICINIVTRNTKVAPLRPKLSGVIKEEGNGVVPKKGERKCGEDRGLLRVKLFHISNS